MIGPIAFLPHLQKIHILHDDRIRAVDAGAGPEVEGQGGAGGRGQVDRTADAFVAAPVGVTWTL